MSIAGITIWPFVILRKKYLTNTAYWKARSKKTINHESIHIKQQEELLILPFYVFYILEWFIKLFFYRFKAKEAYRNISFEREAYSNDTNENYLKTRKRYNWIKLIF